jgi:hypothetical protein
MTPVCIHNLTVFVTVKIPEAGTDSLIEQCQIYMIPVDLYGHNPDLSARLICRILFTKPYIIHCTVCCNEDTSGYDPTGTTANEDLALLMITVNDLIKEVSKKYPESDSILHLIIDGYQKKEIFEQVDLGKGKTQAYSYIEKIQKYAKELYNKKYR